jgi:hypothetical protein
MDPFEALLSVEPLLRQRFTRWLESIQEQADL